MDMTQLQEKWNGFDGKTKLMALGTAVLVAASICLSLGNCTAHFAPSQTVEAPENASHTVEDGVEIAPDAEPIPLATDESKLATSLMEILSKRECVWQASEDGLCTLAFTQTGFTEYDGDLAKSATVEFYSIEVVDNGRAGTWRVTYEDGSTHDATFRFTQSRERGVYRLTSSAFPTYSTYIAKAFTSEDVLEW